MHAEPILKRQLRHTHGRSITLNRRDFTDEEFSNEMEDPRKAFI